MTEKNIKSNRMKFIKCRETHHLQEIAYLAFNQGATWLYKIINYHNMASSRVSLFDAYNSLTTFPNFGANNLRNNYDVGYADA